MISIDPKDYTILKDILKKYPLTIYAYGSRVKGKHKHFSDLDLCIFDDTYKKSDIFDLQDNLRESNLPFTVDVVLWSLMSKDFQQLIRNDLTFIQANPLLVGLEQNYLSKISFLSKKMNFKIEERADFFIFNSGLNSSMFNVVYQKTLRPLPIKEVIDLYEGRPFVWAFPSHTWVNQMATSLLANGFYQENQEYCMSFLPFLLQAYEIPSEIKVKKVTTPEELKDLSSIIQQYNKREHKIYLNEKLIEEDFLAKTPFFVAYNNQNPVGTGSLHFSDDNHAGIHDIFVIEKYRNQGIGSYITKYLINHCHEKGVSNIGLSTLSTSSYKLYEKLGFKLVGKHEYYEWNG